MAVRGFPEPALLTRVHSILTHQQGNPPTADSKT